VAGEGAVVWSPIDELPRLVPRLPRGVPRDAALSGEEPRSSPALYLPYLAAYAQILYVSRGAATLAVALSFTIAVAIFASALRST